jgi:phospholipase/lecithinase/hemolysin
LLHLHDFGPALIASVIILHIFELSRLVTTIFNLFKMNPMKKHLALLVFAGLFIVSCSDDDAVTDPEDGIPPVNPIEYTSGSADLSTFVSLGNSVTAGVSDQALFIKGQDASFPNMLAGSFAEAGGGDFTIPFMADDLGGLTLGGTQITPNRLFLDFSSGSPLPTEVLGTPTTDVTNILAGPFNNMGVPLAKSYHLLAPGYGNVAGVQPGLANPFFARFASSPGTTVFGDALAQSPTFFTLWIGANDVLGYATAGGTGTDQTGNLDPSSYASNDISDPNVVAGSVDFILNQLTTAGAKGVVANIPDVTKIPYFTTVPHNPIPLDEATAGFLNSPLAYGAYNAGIQQLQGLGIISEEEAARRIISFAAGPGNAVVILDEDLTDLTGFNPALINMRQATAEDLLVFTSQTFIGTLADPNNPTSINGVAVPLDDQWVLTPEEQEAVQTATAAYNATIEGLATIYGLAFVDIDAFYNQVETEGIPLADGSVVTDDYAVGGGFSLDGIHPTPRGSALIANEFIKAIEAKYGAVLPKIDPLAYTGLYIN